jgi:hypothetical protein
LVVVRGSVAPQGALSRMPCGGARHSQVAILGARVQIRLCAGATSPQRGSKSPFDPGQRKGELASRWGWRVPMDEINSGATDDMGARKGMLQGSGFRVQGPAPRPSPGLHGPSPGQGVGSTQFPSPPRFRNGVSGDCDWIRWRPPRVLRGRHQGRWLPWRSVSGGSPQSEWGLRVAARTFSWFCLRGESREGVGVAGLELRCGRCCLGSGRSCRAGRSTRGPDVRPPALKRVAHPARRATDGRWSWLALSLPCRPRHPGLRRRALVGLQPPDGPRSLPPETLRGGLWFRSHIRTHCA